MTTRNRAMRQPKKRITRMRYGDGPMGYLSDQIMKEMQRAGYAPREHCLYRSASEQIAMLNKRVSRAGAFESAHQYYSAVDIICERWAWFADPKAPSGQPFWDCLWDCVELVSERFKVNFDPVLSWDLAHVELTGWEDFREKVGYDRPNQMQLDQYFADKMPAVWKARQRALADRKSCR